MPDTPSLDWNRGNHKHYSVYHGFRLLSNKEYNAYCVKESVLMDRRFDFSNASEKRIANLSRPR
jgi:hypothetical protein